MDCLLPLCRTLIFSLEVRTTFFVAYMKSALFGLRWFKQIRNAVEEQRKITQLRFTRLLEDVAAREAEGSSTERAKGAIESSTSASLDFQAAETETSSRAI